MGNNRAQIQVKHTTTGDVLLEIADALDMAIIDARRRESHYSHIGAILESDAASSRVKALMELAEARMRILACLSEMEIAVADRADDHLIASELCSIAFPRRPYVYHGTVFARLLSISERGLVPAMYPVWKNSLAVRNHSAGAVFFTTSWRLAVSWADVAHRTSRGPRGSRGRRRVIVRVPAESLALEPDPLAASPNCLLVRSVVSTLNADVLIDLKGYPDWTPLKTIVEK
jgi:hypothetical protein